MREIVERFHLVFLRALFGAVGSRAVLKGGCNLRFFFGSVRYSEDIDLDAASIAAGTLRHRVEGLLASPAVRAPLSRQGIEIVEVSAACLGSA